MGISAAELASMRAEAAALVLPDTCAIYGMSNTTDAYGDPVLTETLRGTVACALSIESRASQDNAILAQRETSAAFYTLSVGYDTTIEAEDKIVANNKVFRVITLHESQAFLLVKRALVEHTGTAAISLVVEATAQANASTYDAGEVDEDEVVTLTITVTNVGDVLLTLANATASGAVTVGAWSDTTLAPHGTATATVTLNTGTAGAQTGYIEFTSDATPSPYRVNFGFEVESAIVPAPVMSVTGNGVEIANGDATPDAADHTDYGDTPYSITVSRTFTINNTGDADLTGVNVLIPSGYTLVTPPDATIAASGSDTFVVRCDAGSVAALAGNITVESTELADYVFAVTCNSQHPVDAYAWSLAADAVKTGGYQEAARTTPAGQGDPVGSFTDGSGNNRHLAQATGTAKPTLTTDAGVVCLSCDGGDFLTIAGFTLNQPNRVIVVSRLNNLVNTPQIFVDGSLSTNRHAIYGQSATWRFQAGTGVQGSAWDADWHVFDAIFNGASSQLNIDGVLDASGDVGAQTMTGVTIGARNDGGGSWITGFIRAVFIADTDPPANILTSLRNYYANEVLP